MKKRQIQRETDSSYIYDGRNALTIHFGVSTFGRATALPRHFTLRLPLNPNPQYKRELLNLPGSTVTCRIALKNT